MPSIVNEQDPRVQRTRQLIIQTFTSLVEERQHVHSISVQDITRKARINRTTFYAHFEDKYALLEFWMRGKFQRALKKQFPQSATLTLDSLRSLIEVVFSFLALFRDRQKPVDKQFEPLFEIAIQQELYETLICWFHSMPKDTMTGAYTARATAQVISWAIFGPATKWSRGDRTIPANEMASCLLKIVLQGIDEYVLQ